MDVPFRLVTPTRRALLFLGIAALLFFIVFGRRTGPVPATPAPPFSLPDPAGRRIALTDFKGQVVLIDFWATWCEPCLYELPDLKKLQETFKPRGFTILGVSMDEEPGVVAPFLRENKIPYPVVLSGGEAPAGYELPGIPTAFLVGRDGIVVKKYFGPKSYAVLAKDVEGLLK